MTTTHIVLIVLAGIVLMAAMMIGAAAFFSWAWAMEFKKDMPDIFFVRPYIAIAGLFIFLVGFAVTLGPLLAIPLRGMGVLR